MELQTEVIVCLSQQEAVYVSEHFPEAQYSSAGGGANDIIRSHAALQCYPAGDREREGEGGVRQVRQVSDDEEEEEGFSEQQTVRHQCQAFLSV